MNDTPNPASPQSKLHDKAMTRKHLWRSRAFQYSGLFFCLVGLFLFIAGTRGSCYVAGPFLLFGVWTFFVGRFLPETNALKQIANARILLWIAIAFLLWPIVVVPAADFALYGAIRHDNAMMELFVVCLPIGMLMLIDNLMWRRRVQTPSGQLREVRHENMDSDFVFPHMSMNIGDGSPFRPKSRVGFVLFAIFFGALGIHNFYALRIKSAVTQLLLTLFTGVALGALTGVAYAAKWAWWLENGWLVAAIVEPVVLLGVWIWSIVEICVVDRDGRGVPMQ